MNKLWIFNAHHRHTRISMQRKTRARRVERMRNGAVWRSFVVVPRLSLTQISIARRSHFQTAAAAAVASEKKTCTRWWINLSTKDKFRRRKKFSLSTLDDTWWWGQARHVDFFEFFSSSLFSDALSFPFPFLLSSSSLPIQSLFLLDGSCNVGYFCIQKNSFSVFFSRVPWVSCMRAIFLGKWTMKAGHGDWI